MANRAYSPTQIRRAVNLSAFLGWAGFALPFFWESAQINHYMGVVSLLPFAAILGLPIAYGCCWLIGRPILGILLRSPVSWSKAAGWGGAIAGIIAATSIAVGRYRGWRQWQDQTYHSQVGGGDYIRSIDGILTPYGWMVLGQNTLMFIALGMGVALIVRWRIGPGQSESA